MRGTLKERFVPCLQLRDLVLIPLMKPHEQIRASLIYYYSSDAGIDDRGLAFRRPRRLEDRPNEDTEHSVSTSVWILPV